MHSSYDRYSLTSKNYEPHAFYRKHFWWFSTFRTKNIHMSFLFLPAPSHLFSVSATRTARALWKAFLVISTFRTKNIHISCLFQPTHANYDRHSLSSKNYEPQAFYRKHFWCFPHLERRISTYLVCFC